MCAYLFEDDGFDEILNEVDDETLNTNLGETALNVVSSPTNKRQVAMMLAVTEGAMGYCRQDRVRLVPEDNSCNYVSAKEIESYGHNMDFV